MTTKAYRNQDLEIIVCTFEAGSDQPVEKQTVTSLYKQHMAGRVDTIIGVVGKQCKIDVAKFDVALPGGALVWSLPDLFVLLGFDDALEATAGRWCQNSWERWQRFIRANLLQGCLAKSASYDDGATPRYQREDVNGARRVLPTPTVSTGGMMALLCRWAWAGQYAGSVRDERTRACCEGLLWSLLRLIEDVDLRLFLDDEVTRSWPLPWRGRRYVPLSVRSGIVDMDSLVHAVGQQHDHLTQMWFNCTHLNTGATLYEFVKNLSKKSSASGVVSHKSALRPPARSSPR